MHEKIEQFMNENLITFSDLLGFVEENIKNNFLFSDNILNDKMHKRVFTLDNVVSLLKDKARNQAIDEFIQSGKFPKFLSVYRTNKFENYLNEKDLTKKLLELGYTSDDLLVPEETTTVPIHLKKGTNLEKAVSKKHFEEVVKPLTNYTPGTACKFKGE